VVVVDEEAQLVVVEDGELTEQFVPLQVVWVHLLTVGAASPSTGSALSPGRADD